MGLSFGTHNMSKDNSWQKSSQDMLMMGIKQKLANETTIATEDRLIARQAKKERALYDKLNQQAPKEQKLQDYAFMDAGGTYDELMDKQDRWGDYRQKAQNRDGEVLKKHLADRQQAGASGVRMGVPDNVTNAISNQKLDMNDFMKSKLTRGMSTKERLGAWESYQATNDASNINNQNLEVAVDAFETTQAESLDAYEGVAKKSFDDLNTFFGEELSTKPDKLGAFGLFIDKISGGGASKIKAMQPNQGTKEDYQYAAQIMREQEKPVNKQDYKFLVPKGGKIKIERIRLLQKMLEIPEGEVLDRLGITKAQIDGTKRQPRYTDAVKYMLGR